METRTLRLFAFALLALVALAGWLVYRSFVPKESVPLAQNTNDQSPNKPYEPRASGGSAQKPEPVITGNIESQSSTTNIDFDQVFDTFEPFKNIAEEVIPPNTYIAPYTKPKTQNQELVENLFPPYYIASLRTMQDGFVRAGWLSESDNTSFTTEEDVFKFLERGLDAMIAHNVYSSEDAIARARYVVREGFPMMWQREREMQAAKRAQGTILYFFIDKKKTSDLAFYEYHKTDILNGLLSALMPPSAQAQSDLIDTFVTLPDCWKSKDRFNHKGGDNLYSFCCNCGLFCSYGCSFVYDCGKEDSGDCNVPLGCLNSVCKGDYNAVFDGPSGYKELAVFGWGGGFNMDWSFTCGCDK